jgi:hypothetical protein
MQLAKLAGLWFVWRAAERERLVHAIVVDDSKADEVAVVPGGDMHA